MGQSRIEWLKDPTTGEAGFSLNPVKGLCPMRCKDNQGKEYCYARKLYKRFKWNPEIRFETPPIKMPPEGSKIFVGSTMELFGDWIKPQWQQWLFGLIREHRNHTFIFLTKEPQNLIKWSPFPQNTNVGVSVTTNGDMTLALTNLANVEAKVKFISFEPLLGMIGMNDHMPLKIAGISWIIIGQQTPPSLKTSPKMEWVKEIIDACDKTGIPIFLKNNLMDMFVYNQQSILLPYWALNKTGEGGLRQEFPNA